VDDSLAGRSSEVAEGSLVGTDFVDCYQTHYRRLIRALQLSGADQATAQDVAQEAFAQAFARWRSVSKGTNPPGYVYTTAFRLLRRGRRRSAWLVRGSGSRRGSERRSPEPPASNRSTDGAPAFASTRMPDVTEGRGPSSSADPHHEAASHETVGSRTASRSPGWPASSHPTESAALTAVAVETALAAMPPRRRSCAVMCLVLGLSVHDAGAALRIADGTVRKHLEEARADLRAVCDPTL
jgi:RNA polymerase sigma factor (sigma-70 family)